MKYFRANTLKSKCKSPFQNFIFDNIKLLKNPMNRAHTKHTWPPTSLLNKKKLYCAINFTALYSLLLTTKYKVCFITPES